eukprot:TRINITY_DN2113_c1_g1_i3.p1 TRINITY_DN2113_c1_g1~~TRINITY_DN2113_c1_g1_i3.p1  ORF type:complete len:340 (+),score=105.81 TRINITY_DN2113_c1_g1_i3:59-1078(+)
MKMRSLTFHLVAAASGIGLLQEAQGALLTTELRLKQLEEYKGLNAETSGLIKVLDAVDQASKERKISDRYFADINFAQEEELLKLQALFSGEDAASANLLELKNSSATALSNAVDKSAKAAPTKTETVSTPAPSAPATPAAKETKTSHHAGTPISKPPPLDFSKPVGGGGNAQLAISLAMLESLYESSKSRIADLNAREQKSKEFYEKKMAEEKKSLAELEERFKKSHLSQKFHDDEVKDRKRIYDYWRKVRDRQHKQFITALKIQHGTMKKTQQLIELYKKAMSGKKEDKEAAAQALAKMNRMMFLEVSSDLKELKDERAEFRFKKHKLKLKSKKHMI